MKNTNVFICHRPYHILRSCDMICSQLKGSNNILISFNMKKLGRKDYQNHFRSSELEKYFDRVILLERKDCFEKFYTKKFRNYHQNLVDEYTHLIDSIENVDSVYFFSDTEYLIEVLCKLFKDVCRASLKLVDEGTASYYTKDWKKNRFKIYLSEVLSRILGYQLNFRGYGQSKIYDESFAFWPEYANFRKPIHKLNKIDSQLIAGLYSSLHLELCPKRVIYVSSYVDVVYGISKDIEMTLLKAIQKKCHENGYELYIKPHPIQSNSYYDCFDGFICDAQVPVEMIMVEGTVIISPFSSALASAKILGVRSICVARLFGKEDKLIPFFEKIGVEIADNESMLCELLFR